jgi:hypothetical protein
MKIKGDLKIIIYEYIYYRISITREFQLLLEIDNNETQNRY